MMEFVTGKDDIPFFYEMENNGAMFETSNQINYCVSP